ncbi:DNA transfer protein [Caulobacter phage CcrRogue]|uniref:Putative T5 A1-like protein n=1 Tax=Caulobacter phage CcrRogue TaxID=2927986 RepID=K4JQN7_9CAUD|nr:DNA transfer protein [Caulobacter phage CcrRogue]AFU86605.1 putative T5 A1-like protein [Caulobacter phage CcrRogue]
MPAEFEHASKAAKRMKVTLPKDGPFDIYSVEPIELLAMVKKAGGQRAFSRKYSVKRTTLQNRLYAMRKDPFSHRPIPEARVIPVGPDTGRRRFILSSAQDATYVHDEFVDNLEAYAEYLRQDAPCDIMIAGFTYSKRLFEDHAKHASVYHERVMDYLIVDRVQLGDRVEFLGNINALPTNVNPISGLKTYSGERWGIFPHAKVQLASIATMKDQPSKQNMTTGAVTKPNYIPKLAGQKAQHHHQLGAVLVEIDEDGTFFCRHLLGDKDGSFYDLDRFVQDGKVTEAHRITALTPGDIHVAQIDPQVSAGTFGFFPTEQRSANGRVWVKQATPSMIDVLRPENVFLHDVSDFRARNHHNISDPHDRYWLYINGTESVEEELREVAMFMSVLAAEHPDTEIAVVESNHDLALEKWLKTADYRQDPVNAEFFLECQARKYRSIRERESGFSIFSWVMQNKFTAWACEGVKFLFQDQSHMKGKVEHSVHGHNGTNGSRGNIKQFAELGPKVTFGHTHSPGIYESAYNTGTTSLLDMGYNKGPSSWAHTHCVQYPNGKRALITFTGSRWHL